MLSAKNTNVKCKNRNVTSNNIEILHPKKKKEILHPKKKIEMLHPEMEMLTSKNRNVNVQKIEMFSPNRVLK